MLKAFEFNFYKAFQSSPAVNVLANHRRPSGALPKRFLAFLLLEQTRPLHASVAKHNAGSIRVLQKCGFTFLESRSKAPDDADDT